MNGEPPLRGDAGLLLGDAVTCPVQLAEKDWDQVSDMDPALGNRTRGAGVGRAGGDGDRDQLGPLPGAPVRARPATRGQALVRVRTPRLRQMGIVDDLLANPGLYVGTDTVVRSDLVGAVRIVLSPLPGGAGVSLDY